MTAVGRLDDVFAKQTVSIFWAGLSRSQHTEGQWRQLGNGDAVNFCPNREASLSNWQPARLWDCLFEKSKCLLKE